MVKGMNLVLNAFKNDRPFCVVVMQGYTTVFEGDFESLKDFEYPGFEVADEVSLSIDSRVLTIYLKESYD